MGFLASPLGVVVITMMDLFLSADISLGIAVDMMMDLFVSDHFFFIAGNNYGLVAQRRHCPLLLQETQWLMCFSMQTLPLTLQ